MGGGNGGEEVASVLSVFFFGLGLGGMRDDFCVGHIFFLCCKQLMR